MTAIEYSEARYVNAANSGEGGFSGLYVDDAHGTTSLVAEDPPGLFATSAWTNVSMHVASNRFPSLSTFHVGYMREIQVNPGSRVLQHGIDNVTIRICR